MPISSPDRRDWLLAAMASLGSSSFAWAQPAAAVVRIDEEWRDGVRSRTLPVRLYLPNVPIATAPAPALRPEVSKASNASIPWVIFSHGLGGSRAGGRVWGEALASAGYLAVHIQHPGSDEAIWKGKPPVQGALGLREGATGEQLLARIGDVRFVLDEVARRAKAQSVSMASAGAGSSAGPALRWATINVPMVMMSGHSFGAVTTQALMGQRFGVPSDDLAPEPRFVAAMAYSPSARQPRPVDSFAAIGRPFMSITGTQDAEPELLQTPGRERMPASARQVPYQEMPAGHKYLLVVDGADHMMFNGEPDVGRRVRSPEMLEIQNRLISAGQSLLTLFASAYLRQDTNALAQLQSATPIRLAPQDRWAFK
jgi:predicted dienelactone hydrolase